MVVRLVIAVVILGGVGAMLQTGALIRDLSVRERRDTGRGHRPGVGGQARGHARAPKGGARLRPGRVPCAARDRKAARAAHASR